MNWVKRKIIQWVRDDWNSVASGNEPRLGVKSIDSIDHPPVLTFKIYSATNGQILEFNRYDRKHDQHNHAIYIVEKDKDIGEYVARCLSVELLK